MKQSKQAVASPLEIPGQTEPNINGFELEESLAVHRGLIDWLWVFWNERHFLQRVAGRTLLVATLVAFLIPPRYQSTTRLMPPDQDSGTGLAMLAAMSGKSANLGTLAGDLLGTKRSGDLFLDIMQSRTVEDRLVERFDLRKVYGTHYWEGARKELAANTSLSEDRKSGVITITVMDRNPQRAQQLAQAYVEELDHLLAQVSTSSARRERQFIEERLKTVKQDLEQASKQFSEYASQNTAIDITAQAKAMLEGAASVEGELIAAQSELEALEQIYTPNNVRVRSLRARVEELKRQLQKLGGDSSTPSPQGNANSTDLQAQQFPPIRQLPLLGVRWADLYRQTKIQETVYELLTQQYELAKIQEAKEVPVVKVLDAPVIPERKSSPRRLLIVVLGTFFGLAAGCVWLLGKSVWSDLDRADPRKTLAREVAVTLQMRARYWRERWRQRRSNESEARDS